MSKKSKNKDTKKDKKDKKKGKAGKLELTASKKSGKTKGLSKLGMGAGAISSAVIGAIASEVAQALLNRSPNAAHPDRATVSPVQNAVDTVKTAVGDVVPSVTNAIDVVKNAVEQVKPLVTTAVDGDKVAQAAKSKASGAVDRVKDKAAPAADKPAKGKTEKKKSKK